MMGGFIMIALPQCLEFPYDDRSREVCDFYLQILEIKNKERQQQTGLFP